MKSEIRSPKTEAEVGAARRRINLTLPVYNEAAQLAASVRRVVLSRGYNALLRGALGLRVKDAQCGFKALSRAAAERLLPAVEDEGWFFDTELLWRAQRAGLRSAEIPVHWVEDADTRCGCGRPSGGICAACGTCGGKRAENACETYRVGGLQEGQSFGPRERGPPTPSQVHFRAPRSMRER